MSKKILSLLLAIIMILGMFPTTALAAGNDKGQSPLTITNNSTESDKEKNGGYIVVPESAEKNTTVTINVYPNAGYKLTTLVWNSNNKDNIITIEDDKFEYTFKMPSKDVTVTATFKEDQVGENITITYSAAEGGSVDPTSETINSVSGSAQGSTATPATGYHFVKWTDSDNNEVGTNENFVPEKTGGAYVTATYTANFALNEVEPTKYTITNGTAQNANGTITLPENAAAGETVTVTSNTPNDGYKFKTITVVDADSNPVEVTNNSFKMPESNVTVTAVFAKIRSITNGTAQSANGSITIDPQVAIEGETVTVTVTPNNNYILDTLRYECGEDTGSISLTTDGYRFAMPEGENDVTVTATFAEKQGETYTITNGTPSVNNNSQKGYIDSISPMSASEGETITVYLVPLEDKDYRIKSLTYKEDTGTEEKPIIKKIKSNEFQFTMPAANVTVNAIFAKKNDKITIGDPTAETGLVYDGQLKTGVYEGLGYTLTGNTATNAGNYTATATLETGYVWVGGETGTKEIKWSIAKATYDMSGVTFTDKTETYDGSEKSITISGNLPTGVQVSYTNNTGTDAGTYTATATFTGDSTNYEAIESKTATLTIKPTEDAVEPTPATNLTYTGQLQSCHTTSGTGANVTLDGDLEKISAGTYEFTATPNKNHAWSNGGTGPKTYNWSIAKASLTATAQSFTVAYGDPIPAYDVSYEGWVTGDAEEPTTSAVLTSDYTTTSPVGTYAITFSAVPEFTNYSVTTVNGTLTVNPATITEATAAPQEYTGSALTPVLTVKAGELIATYDLGNWSGDLTNAGTYTATATGKGNFKGSLTVSFTINPATITEATAASREYTGFALTPDLTVKAGDLDATYNISAWSGALVEPGKYTATVTGNGNFTGTEVVEFTITHTHNPVKVVGKTPTISAAGWKDYYGCKDAVSPTTSCHKYFEDEKGNTPIANLDTWKAENGAGYIPKLPCISGTVQQQATPTNEPVSGATVKLFPEILGVAETTTDANGNYYFYDIPAGTYDIVVTKDGKTITKMVTFTAAGTMNVEAIVFPIQTVNSEVVHTGTEITNTKSNISETVVGGLDKIAEEAVVEGKTVTIKLEVEPKAYSGTDDQKVINELAGEGKIVEFLDLQLTKQVDEIVTDIGDSNDKLLTIVIPFDFSDVKVNSIMILRCHKGNTIKMTKNPAEGEEGFVIDEVAGTITIRAKTFSTYAISFDDDSYVPARKGSSNVITIGNREHTEEETNPDTGAPVMSMSTGMVLLAGIALILSKRR